MKPWRQEVDPYRGIWNPREAKLINKCCPLVSANESRWVDMIAAKWNFREFVHGYRINQDIGDMKTDYVFSHHSTHCKSGYFTTWNNINHDNYWCFQPFPIHNFLETKSAIATVTPCRDDNCIPYPSLIPVNEQQNTWT